MVLQPGLEQLEGSLHITVLAVHFGERGEGQAVRILGVPALEFSISLSAIRIPELQV